MFINVQLKYSGSQTGSLLNALVQTAMTLSIGNSVFPTDYVAISYIVVTSVIALYFLVAVKKSNLDFIIISALLFGLVCMTITGIGVKPRNSVYLIPLIILLLASAISSLPRWAEVAAVLMVVVFRVFGVLNVVNHENTIKGSYNTNYRASIEQIRQWKDNQCDGQVFVLNHDVVLSYLLNALNIQQSSPYKKANPAIKELQFVSGSCLVVVKTYRANSTQKRIDDLYQSTKHASLELRKSADIGMDRYYLAKSAIGHEKFPSYYLHLDLYKTKNDITIPDWYYIYTTSHD